MGTAEEAMAKEAAPHHVEEHAGRLKTRWEWVFLGCSLLLCLCLGLVDVYNMRQTRELRHAIANLEHRVQILQEPAFPFQTELPHLERRRRRSVDVSSPKRTADGVPILDVPYSFRKSQDVSRQDSLTRYQKFSAEETSEERDDRPSLLPHHRSSAVFVPSDAVEGPVNSRPVTSQRERLPADAPSSLRRSQVTPRHDIFRNSRVPSDWKLIERTSSGSRVKQPSKGSPVLEAIKPPIRFTSVRPEGYGSARRRLVAPWGRGQIRPSKRRRRKMMEKLEKALGCTAAHFEGQVNNTTLGAHSSVTGLLRNNYPESMFSDWLPADWMTQRDYIRDFDLHGGQVTIRKPGVYLVYAQINYMDPRYVNGFEVQINARPFITCLTMDGSDMKQKANTCYTAAATYLNVGDAVSVKDLDSQRVVMFLPQRSFFGLVRLAGTGH